MKTYRHILNKKMDFKFPAPLEGKDICFLDIETTGLSREYNQIYLIGLVYFDKLIGNWLLKQFFAENLQEEKEVLEGLNREIASFDLIVTYNGHSFDLPFINRRMEKLGIKNEIKDIQGFDIYRELRRNASYLSLDNLRLKTVEESLGIYRLDEYSGKDCIKFYYKYVNSGDEISRERILRHNYDDLFYLVDVLEIFNVIKEIKSFEMEIDKVSLASILDIEIRGIFIEKDILTIKALTSPLKTSMDIVYYDEYFNLKWENGQSLTIDLNIKEGMISPEEKCVFIVKANLPIREDLKNLSKYQVPHKIILLEVEGKFLMDNIKNIIKELVLYVLE